MEEVKSKNDVPNSLPYATTRILTIIRNYARVNRQVWAHYPEPSYCVLCGNLIERSSTFMGSLASIAILPCCTTLAHKNCLTFMFDNNTYPKCKVCGSDLETQKRIDVDSDILHYVFARNKRRDRHNMPRCYPNHELCVKFEGFPE